MSCSTHNCTASIQRCGGGGGFPSAHRVPSWQRFAPSLDSIPDRPARSQSLYWLSYPTRLIFQYKHWLYRAVGYTYVTACFESVRPNFQGFKFPRCNENSYFGIYTVCMETASFAVHCGEQVDSIMLSAVGASAKSRLLQCCSIKKGAKLQYLGLRYQLAVCSQRHM